MKLFIQIKDEKPFEHPIFDWNFRDAFPDIDPDNLPPEFAVFERVDCNIEVGTYEVPYCTYEFVGPVVKDVWKTRPMNDEERIQKDLELAEIAAQIARQEEELKKYEEGLDNSGSAPNVIE